MKLIPKIYLSFGFILLVFSFVTIMYLRQSRAVERATAQAIHSTELLHLTESLEKIIVDIETGVRGFQVTRSENFLAPYHSGREAYEARYNELEQMVGDRAQRQRLAAIDSAYRRWISGFTLPAIELKRNELTSAEAAARYQDFLVNVIVAGKGKAQVDHMRAQISAFEEVELLNRQNNLASLDETIRFTDSLSVALTVGCIFIGILVVVVLARTIGGRLNKMAAMADEVAQRHFSVQIVDDRNDEISQVTHSLNLMARKLNASFTELEKSNKELDQFAYVVSHDLKAPLRAINSLAEWIEEDLPQLEPDVQRNLELLRGRVHRMENLINGILEYARISRRQFPLATFSVTSLVEEVFETHNPDNSVQLLLETDLPELTTERILLQQVFSNLISNAIKYNDKPQACIRIGCQDQPQRYEFYVADNGPGIPEAFHEKIFGIFQTIESRDTRESTGVGLAIVKKIVAEKGGSITIASREGEGSRFVFSWPKVSAPKALPETVLQPL